MTQNYELLNELHERSTNFNLEDFFILQMKI